ncbi:unnamed protein product [Heligmosomoides polygyrus]|uniref:Uncharacterized protein n=1 Tax=Heligmosomoides polygyrus TaxID=6339 RepID=A0A183F201_HELPZ|nr:unnamed protein product [Heligmosomoides polygyrus]
MSAIAVVLVVLGAGLIHADENVKNATAAGSYGYTPPYFGPNFYGGFNPYFFGRGFLPLINTHVCSVDASYAVYATASHHRNHRRPHILDCADAYSGVYNPTKTDHGYSSKSCDKCCKKAAHLDAMTGMTENEILGMVLVLQGKPKCACCAPYRPYERVMAVPVQYPPPYSPPQYQPPYQQNSYQQPPFYPPNNNQPTGY